LAQQLQYTFGKEQRGKSRSVLGRTEFAVYDNVLLIEQKGRK
jgi:hypothetical protein